jgi:Zn finger protein HypA/HybF involved in hydrogenase expression
VGEFIASGTTDAAGYGTTSIERAQFIIETIRTHLARQSCSHYVDKLEEIDALLGVPALWCPRCGAHLPDR